MCEDVLPQIRKSGAYPSKGYYHRRDDDELGKTEEEKRETGSIFAQGRQDELHHRVVRHVRETYPFAALNFGGTEHQQANRARMDSYLKGYEGGCPDITITLPVPNAFHYD